MAGREGGGGVMGQSQSNSERLRTTADGTTDTDGSGQTLKCFLPFVLYHLIVFFRAILYNHYTLFLYHSLCVNLFVC